MKKLFLASLITLAMVPATAHAAHRGASPNLVPTAPVLQAVTVPYGNLTRTGHGTVRLNSPPVTTAAVNAVSYPGLGLLAPTSIPCDTWTLSFVSNSASRPGSDFTLPPANTAEGAAAITPGVSSTGQGNLAGNYVWNVSCVGNGFASNTVQLTYQTVTNAVNLAQADRQDFGATPAGFGNVAGAQVLFSVGSDFHAIATNQMRFAGAFTNKVKFTPADVARLPYMSHIGIGGSMSNLRVTGFILSGSLPSGVNVVMGGGASTGNTLHDIDFDHMEYHGSQAMINGNSAFSGFGLSCTGGPCTFTDSLIDYTEAGMSLGNNMTYQRINIRHIYSDCMNMQNVTNVLIEDFNCIAPMIRAGGNHTDTMQIADQATPNGVTVRRFTQIQGDGDDVAQGPYFGGAQLGSGASPFKAYIDDGTAAHGPGTIITRVSGYWGTGAGNSTIVIPGVIASSDGVTINCIPACNTAGTPTTGNVTGIAPTVIGSPASPVNVYGVGTQNFKMSGIMAGVGSFHGFTQGGNAGTSWLYDFDYHQGQGNPFLTSTFQASATGGIMTVTNTCTSNVPGEPCFIGGRLNYPGCNYCSTNQISSKISGSDQGPGQWNLTGGAGGNFTLQTLNSSASYPLDGAWGEQSNCNTPHQSGTLNIDRGYFQGGYFANGGGCAAGVNFPSSNTTVGTKVFGYSPNGTLSAADYASGMLPSAYILAHPSTGSTTPAQMLTIECLANKGKIGGKKDLGGGLWAGAVTGETDAINHTGGGDWIIFDGTSHVVSNHIPGCEAAP